MLAGAIILSLNNSGIIGKANEAVSESDYKNIQTAAQLVYSDILLGESTGGLQQGEYIKQQLIADGIITEEVAALYKFKNNGTVKKLQTKEEYEEMYKDELAAMEGHYTITNGLFKLSAAGETALQQGELTTITIPYGVTTIAKVTAAESTTLTKIIMPDTVTKLEVSAFRDCSNLTDLVLSKQLNTIEGYSFRGSNLKATTNDGLAIYEGYLLDGSSAAGNIKIPDDVEVIGEGAFKNNKNLTGVDIPDTVYLIERDAFYYCNNLTKIEGAENVSYMEDDPFWTSGIYKNVSDGPFYIGKVLTKYWGDIPDEFEVKPGTVTILRIAIPERKNLKRVILPDTIRYIGQWAFQDCTNLTEVLFKGNISDIDIVAQAFEGTGITGELRTKIEAVQPEAFGMIIEEE